MEDSIYQRTEILIGKESQEKLKDKCVLICGIGGVGSYVLEALARVGIGKFIIVDKDIVDITNINRQIIATTATVGQDKVLVAKKRVESINKEANVIAIKENITKENINDIFTFKDIDYVVDCVDNIDAKIAIIQKCNMENVVCISCMGMGNRLDPLSIKVCDIYKTNTCPVARLIRKKLRKLGINKQKVVFSTEEPKKKNEEEKLRYGNTLGSISFVPSVAGLVIASETVKDLLKD